MFDSLSDWVAEVVTALGYVGVAALVALESVFPPIPSEVVLPLAGFVAGSGDASVGGMVLAATVGSVCRGVDPLRRVRNDRPHSTPRLRRSSGTLVRSRAIRPGPSRGVVRPPLERSGTDR